MFLHFNNRIAHCLKTNDSGNDGEYYWTWQVLAGKADELAIAQGFSIRPRIEDGMVIREGETLQDLNDPKFTIQLPDVENGQMRKVRVDIFCWEHDSDRDTAAIKKVFTNTALQKLSEIYADQSVRRRDALTIFGDWLKGEPDMVLPGQGLSSVTSMIPIAPTTLPMLTSVMQLLTSDRNRDDLIGVKQVELFYTKVADDSYQYRWLGDTGIEEVYTDERPPIWHEFHFVRSDGREVVVTKSFFQVIFDMNEAV